MTKVLGTEFNDVISGAFLNGNDTIFTFGGDDLVRSDAGFDFVSAGAGDDSVAIYGGVVRLGSGNDFTSLTGDGVVYGGTGNDTLMGTGDYFGDDGKSIAFGGPGNDALDGEGGDDVYSGGPGADTFIFYTDTSGRPVVTDFQHGVDTFQVSTNGGQGDFGFDEIFMVDLGPATLVGWHMGSSYDTDGFIVLGNEPITESDFQF